MAVTIKMKKTGKLVQVTRNVAFDLIDKGEAERVYEKKAVPVTQEPTGYPMQDIGAGSDNRHNGYPNRQLRPKTK